jgi:ferric-dicitrate binding protein FerR (iron transport regulator)
MNREEFFDRFLRRDLNREELEQLKALLRTDVEAAQQFVEHVRDTSLMIRVGTQLQSVPEQAAEIVALATAHGRAAPVRRRAFGWKWAALAACLAVLAAGGWIWSQSSAPLHATVTSVSGEVSVLRDGKSITADPGLKLRAGDLVQAAARAGAVIAFDGEPTRAELQGGASVKFGNSRHGKRLELSQGSLEATVGPQPRGRPMTLLTLHAEAKVMGTRFLLASEVSSTRLEVTEGTVQFTCRNDGKSLVVKSGFSATASPNIELSVQPFLPAPWASQDVGAVGLRGQARLNGSTFRVRGAGQDTCLTKDQLHFVYQPIEGDCEIVARVSDIEFTDPEAKAGVMIRQSLKSASPQASVGITAAGTVEFEHRPRTESCIKRGGHTPAPCWVRLVRRSDVVTGFVSSDGVRWNEIGTSRIHFTGRAYIGLGVTSFNHAALSTSMFDNVTITKPGVAPAVPN